MVNVRATLLDDARWFVLFIETYASEALPWACTPARHGYPDFPPAAAYSDLITD